MISAVEQSDKVFSSTRLIFHNQQNGALWNWGLNCLDFMLWWKNTTTHLSMTSCTTDLSVTLWLLYEQPSVHYHIYQTKTMSDTKGVKKPWCLESMFRGCFLKRNCDHTVIHQLQQKKLLFACNRSQILSHSSVPSLIFFLFIIINFQKLWNKTVDIYGLISELLVP